MQLYGGGDALDGEYDGGREEEDATQAILARKRGSSVLLVPRSSVNLNEWTLTGPSERTGVLNYGHGGPRW